VRTVEKETETVSGKLNEKRPTFARNSLDVSFSSSSPTPSHYKQYWAGVTLYLQITSRAGIFSCRYKGTVA